MQRLSLAGGEDSAPPQLDPAPAVHPKQWLAVAMARPSNASRDSMSKIVRAGPGDDWTSWFNLFPPMLSALTVFLLVFYLNHCFVRYQTCYDICQDLKKAVLDVMILGVGTIGEATTNMYQKMLPAFEDNKAFEAVLIKYDVPIKKKFAPFKEM